MKVIGNAILVSLILGSTMSLANDQKLYQSYPSGLFGEIGIGAVSIDHVSSKTYTGSYGSSTFASGKLTNTYDDALTTNFEFGSVVSREHGIRVSLSHLSFDAELSSAAVSGSITAGGTTYSGSTSITRADVAATGLNFDNEVKLLSLMTYKDFHLQSPNVVPFLGFGVGRADVSNAIDKVTAFTYTLGTNVDLGNNFYISIKWSLVQAGGIKDKADIEYEDLSFNEIRSSIGLRF